MTDDGLQHLSSLTGLQHLNMAHCTAITDAGLPHLESLIALKDLKVTRTAVTTEGAARLQKNLPGVTIQLKYIEGN